MPHTADLQVEAWSETAEGCIAEAVRGVVEGFVDPHGAGVVAERAYVVTADSDEDLLVRVMEELIYRMDTGGEIPLATQVGAIRSEEGRRTASVRFRMADVGAVAPIGAVPKAVSLHDLHLGGGPGGWTCRVTVDV